MSRVEAVILKKYPSSEADEVVVALTKQKGKMYLRARGIKKPAAKHAGLLRELMHVNLFFVEGRSLPIIIDTQPLHTFSTVTGNVSLLRAARTVISLVESTSARGGQDAALWGDLVEYLQALNKAPLSSSAEQAEKKPKEKATVVPLPLAPVFFVYKLLIHHGMQPVLEHCTICGKNYTAQTSSFFSAPSGGLLCEECVYADQTALSVSPATLKTLIYWHTRKTEEFVLQPTDSSSGKEAEITKAVEHFGRWHFGTPLTLQV